MTKPLDILLVGAFESDDSSRLRFLAPQLGIERLAAFVRRRGFSAQTVDPNIDGEAAFHAAVQKFRPRVVGFSISYVTLINDLSMIHFTKKTLPEALIIAGGQQATFDYKNILRYAPIDLIVLGEGERPLLEILENVNDGVDAFQITGTVYRDGDEIIRVGNNEPMTPAQFREATLGIDFTQIDYGKYWASIEKFYDKPNYLEINTIRLFTLNYCPFQCIYCSSRSFLNAAKGSVDLNCEPRGAVTRMAGLTAQDMLEHVTDALKAYPDTRRFMLQDDEHLLVKGRVEGFCRLVIDAKKQGHIPAHLEFMCQARVNDVNPDVLALMNTAGYSLIGYGVETFSDPMLKSIRKKNSAADIYNALRWTLAVGIKPFINLMLFLPEIARDTLFITIDNALDYIEKGVEVAVEPFVMPLPGSYLYYQQDYAIHKESVAIPHSEQTMNRYHFVIPKDKAMADLAFTFFNNQADHLQMVVDRFGFNHLPTRLRSLIVFHNIAGILKDGQRLKRIEGIFKEH